MNEESLEKQPSKVCCSTQEVAILFDKAELNRVRSDHTAPIQIAFNCSSKTLFVRFHASAFPDHSRLSGQSHDQGCGFYSFPLFCMENQKANKDLQKAGPKTETAVQQSPSLLALAYSSRKKRRWDQITSLPGPAFDIVVLGMFVVLGIAWLAT